MRMKPPSKHQLGQPHNGDAYAQLGRTIVRPQQSGGIPDARIIKCPNWISCSQFAPAVVQTLNPATLSLFSNTNDSYDSTTNGFKSVVKFAAPTNLKKPGVYPPVLAFNAGARYGQAGSITYNTYTIGAGLIAPYVRIRAITADFTVSTLAWNGLAGLTIGDTLLEQAAAAAVLPITVAAGTTAAYNYSLADDGVFGEELPFLLTTTNTTPVYGLLIECKPHLGPIGGAPSLIVTSINATGSIQGIVNPQLYLPLF